MKHLPILVLAALAAVPAVAQNRASLIYTGRFPFVSLDNVNERAGGSITQLSEFAFSVVTPGTGAFARSWVPATTHEAYFGDTAGTGDYTPLRGLKTYFERINLAGPFVKAADKGRFDPRLIYWTVRDQEANIDIVVPSPSGPIAVLPGDFVRVGSNGNLEYFVTQAELLNAAGAQTGSYAAGASALCQDAQGNLYYTPAEGGHWVNGNQLISGAKFAYDGSICKIPASAITYDAQGNVASIAIGSAYMMFSEIEAGLASGPSVRGMVSNANAYDNTGGTPLSITANIVGLDLDPNGTTTTSAWPLGDPSAGGIYETVPDLVFTFDNGTWGGTIFSTAGNGSLALINGVKCGSDVQGVPADGSWIGVVMDVANFQPTMMGLAVIPELPFDPLVADAPDFGALAPAAANVEVDFNTVPNSIVGVVMQFGPQNAGGVPTSVDFGQAFGQSSWNTLFTVPTPTSPSAISLPVLLADGFGYATLSFPNPMDPGLTGLTLLTQGVTPGMGGGVQVSNPTLVQLK